MRFKLHVTIEAYDDNGHLVKGEIDDLVYEDRSIKVMWVKFSGTVLAMFTPDLGGQDLTHSYTLTFPCNPWK